MPEPSEEFDGEEQEEEDEFALLVRRKRRIGRIHRTPDKEHNESVAPKEHVTKRMRLKRARISTSDEDDLVLGSDDEIEESKEAGSKVDWFAPLGSDDDDEMESEDEEMPICDDEEEPETLAAVPDVESEGEELHL